MPSYKYQHAKCAFLSSHLFLLIYLGRLSLEIFSMELKMSSKGIFSPFIPCGIGAADR